MSRPASDGPAPDRRTRRAARLLTRGRRGGALFFYGQSRFRPHGPHHRDVSRTTRRRTVPCPARARGWRGCAPSCPRSALRASLRADRRATGGQTPRAPPDGASPAGPEAPRLSERAFLTHTPAEPASCRTRAPGPAIDGGG